MKIIVGRSLTCRLALAVCTIALELPAAKLCAGTYYWDVNGSTAGAGASPSGTWGTGSTWTTNSSGTATTLAYTTSASDSLYFVAGAGTSSGNSAFNVNVIGAQNAYGVTFASSGAVSLSGTGVINVWGGGITMPQYAYGSTSQGAATISASIVLQDNQTWRNNSVNPYTIEGNVINNGFLWTIGGAGNTTFSGYLTGSGGLTKIGNGILTLQSDNTFSGSTSLTSGTLNLSDAYALQASTLVASSGALVFDQSVDSGIYNVGALSGSANIALQNNATSPNAIALNVGGNNATTTYTGALSGPGTLVMDGVGMLTLTTTNNSYGGGTTLTAGTLALKAPGALPNYGSSSALLTVGSGAMLTLSVGGTGWTTANVASLVAANNGGFALGSTLGIDTTSATSASSFSGSLVGDMALMKLGPNTLTLTSTGNFIGMTTMSGGTLDLANSTALQNSTLVVPSVGFQFDPSVHSFSLGGLSGSGNLSLLNGAAITLTVGGNNTSTNYAGSLSGSGSLVKKGAGTLTLAGSNGFNSLSISSGGVLFAGTGSLTTGSTGALYIGTSGPGAVTIQDSAVVITNELDVNYQNTSAGASSLTITGGSIHATGQTYIGRAQMNTGPGTISAAVYQSGGTATLSGAATVGYNGSATSLYNISGGVLNASGGLTVGGNLANGSGQGNGALNILDSAVVNVAGGSGLLIGQDINRTTSGSVNLSGGTLAVTGNVTFGNAGNYTGIGSLSRSGGVMTASGNLVVDGNATILLDDTTGNVATSFGGNLLRNGQGTLVIVPQHGAMSLTTSSGTTSAGESLLVGKNPAPGGGIIGSWAVRQASGSDSSGDYLTSLSLSSSSYLLVTASYNSTFSTTTTSSVVSIASSNNLTQNVAISALKLGPYALNVSGTGGLTLESGGLITNGGTLSGNSVSFSNVEPLIYAGSAIPSKISSSLVSDIGLTKFGAGSLILAGNNSGLLGSVYVSAGTLDVTNSGALGTGGASTATVAVGASFAIQGNTALATVPITINGTGLNAAGSLENIQDNNSLAGAVNLGSNSLINTAGGTLTLNGAVQGAYNLTKSGSGTLVLAGSSGAQFPLLVTASAGDLRVQNSQGLGPGGTLGVVIGNGATLQLQGGVAIPSLPLSVSGVGAANNGAIENLQGTNSFAGAITLAGNSQVNVDSGALTLSGAINGGFSLTESGTSMFTLSGNNAFTGALSILGGTLSVPSLNSAGSSGPLGAGTAPVSLGNNGLTATLLYTGTGGTTNRAFTLAGNGGNFQFNSNASFSGVINGNGSLTKAGSGVLTLTGSNLFTGATYVNAGSVVVGPGGSIAASSGLIVAQGASLQATAGTSGGSQLPAAGNLSLSGGSLSYAANGTYWPGESVGALVLNPGQSQIVLTNAGSNTPYLAFASGTTHTTGATIGFSASNAQIEFITNPPSLVGGILPYAFYGPANSTTVDFATLSASSGSAVVSNLTYSASTSGNISTMTLGSPLNVTGTGTLSTMTSAHEFNSLKLNSASALSMTGTATLTLDSGGLICTGASTAISGGTISAPAGELIIDTATNLSIASVLSASSALVKTGTATLTLTSTQPIVGNTFINQGTLNFLPAGSLTYSGVISGAGNVLLSGSALTLSGSDTYFGSTSITAGTLTVSGAIAGGGGVTIQSGAVLAGSGTIVGNVSAAGGIIALTSTAAKIAGSVSVGSGTLSVGQTGVGNYLTTTAGLFVTGSGALVASSTATNIVGGLTYSSSANSTYAGQLSGSATVLTLNAPSSTTLTLSNSSASTFGGVVVQSGILKLAASNAIGSNLVTMSGGTLDLDGLNAAPLFVSGSGGVISDSKTGSVTLNIDPGGSLSYGGKITNGSGTVALEMSGSGTQVLSGTNTFTGGLLALSGTSVLSGASSLLAGTSLTIGNASGEGAVFSSPMAIQNSPPPTSSLSPVPEPGSAALLLAGIAGLAVVAIRKRKGR